MTYEEAIERIRRMQRTYSHIRNNSSEWEALELAKEALAGKEQKDAHNEND